MKKIILIIGIIAIFLGNSLISTSVAQKSPVSEEINENPIDNRLFDFYLIVDVKGIIDDVYNWGLFGGLFGILFEGNYKIFPRISLTDGTIDTLSPFDEIITVSPSNNPYGVTVDARFANWAVFEDNGDETYYVEGKLFLVEVLGLVY